MKQRYKFKLDKLIRDKIPEVMLAKGAAVLTRVMEREEHARSLKDKLLEETKEVMEVSTQSKMKEELADVLEVVYSLGNEYGISPQDIEVARVKKKKEKGGFDKRIYGVHLEMDSDNECIAKYPEKLKKYPRIDEEVEQ